RLLEAVRVIATGESHSVREFVELAFREVGLNWEDHVKVDHKLFRWAEVEYLTGDYSKTKRVFGWKPDVRFEELVKMMVKADVERYPKHEFDRRGCS
ncbi:MAG: GDP-mannose 4,6-dehydratase, partial [Desulfobacterales bacterium]|nr:GDP-mannose 4,6-dehydratase [Desulfobacterales bacterium]